MTVTDTATRIPSPTFADLFGRSGIGQRELCRRAAMRGFQLYQQTVERLVAAPMREYPKPETIEALAAGLDVPYDEVLGAITASLGRPARWSRLSPDNGT
jgi:hypothetical protein